MSVTFQSSHFAKKSQVPRRFVPFVNKLLTMATELTPDAPDFAARLHKLNRAQRRYNRRVEGYIRFHSKHGLAHKPNNTVKVGLASL